MVLRRVHRNQPASNVVVKLDLEIQPQPNDETCGPTCLHAIYRYYGDEIPLSKVIREVPRLSGGGTLAVLLACHALRRGYSAQIYTYNLQIFDPTWFDPGAPDLRKLLKAQLQYKKAAKFRTATEAYIEFLNLGGQIRFEELTKPLIRKYLNNSIPILTGLSSTYLYRCPREHGPNSDYHSVRGVPAGHFVILAGYDKERRSVELVDPLLPNPVSKTHRYEVTADRLICAILLGIVTYDANLLIIQPR